MVAAISLATIFLAGMLLQFRPIILSGLARMQTEWGDTRLNNYILEHSYRWLIRAPEHERFWSPPVFFSAPNTAAYSDLLLGVAPLYWPWRVAGFEPDTAFQLWMLTVATLNYVCAFALFFRGFRCRPVASAVGAMLLSFAAMRTAQVMHAQLLPIFYIAIAIFAVLRVFEDESFGRQRMWIGLLAFAVVAQLWSSFYYAWFLLFALLLAGPWALTISTTRAKLISALGANLTTLIAASVASAALLAPLLSHYLHAESELGPRSFVVVETMLPRLQSWMYFGGESSLYGSLASHELFRNIPMGHEQRLGIGVVTLLCASIGLWNARRRRVVQIVVLVPLTMVLLATEWPGGFTAWRLVWQLVPGAGALRAVSRIGVAVLVPVALGVALCVDAILRHVRLVRVLAATLVISAITWEQLDTPESYDKSEGRARVARVVAQLPRGCSSFLYTTIGGSDDPWRYHLDAMWASMQAGIPTVNGYSGNQPPGWTLYDIRIHSAAQEIAVSDSLRQWAVRWGIDRARICRVRTPPG